MDGLSGRFEGEDRDGVEVKDGEECFRIDGKKKISVEMNWRTWLFWGTSLRSITGWSTKRGRLLVELVIHDRR